MTDRCLETPRLWLEPIPLAVAGALLAGRPVPGLVAGAGWPHPDTLDALRMDVALGEADRTGWFVVRRDDRAVIGECGWRGGPDPAGSAEIGYGLAAPYRGRGYGTELVAAMVGWCVRQPGLRQLVATVLPGNVPSRRVLERVGFTATGAAGDLLVYTLPVVHPAGGLEPPRPGPGPQRRNRRFGPPRPQPHAPAE